MAHFRTLCHATNFKFLCVMSSYSLSSFIFLGDPDTVNAAEFSFLLLVLWFLRAHICLLCITHYAGYKAYADDVNILGGSIHTLKENAEALVAATREIGLEVSADKTKYMVMS